MDFQALCNSASIMWTGLGYVLDDERSHNQATPLAPAERHDATHMMKGSQVLTIDV